MKRALILFLISLFGFVCVGQQMQQLQQRSRSVGQGGFYTHIDYNGKEYNWEKVNDECYNCASFYHKVIRSVKSNDGYYYYYVYFFSNSYDHLGYLTNTYVSDVNVFVQSKNLNIQLVDYSDYVLIPPKTDYYDGLS